MLRAIRFFILLTLAISTSAFSAQITVVSVTANGFGQSESEAIAEAIVNGISQVNGESIASSMRVTKKTFSSTDKKTQGDRSIEKELDRKTKGVVKSWKKISCVSTNQSFTATVSVQVFVLTKSNQLERLKIAVVPPQTPSDELTDILISGLSTNLASNRKFALIDKRNNKAITNQLNEIRQHAGAIEDQVRLGAEVAPDFIAVANIYPMQSKDNKYVIEASLEIIDYATRQVKFSEKKTANLNSSDEASVNKQINMLAKRLARVVIETIYPPLIVGADEESVTIAQGSDFFNVGDKCIIRERLNVLRDPYTKEFLGYEQKDIGSVEIIYTDKRISKAKIMSKLELSIDKIASKKYQIWRSGDSSIDLFKAADADLEGDISAKTESKNTDY